MLAAFLLLAGAAGGAAPAAAQARVSRPLLRVRSALNLPSSTGQGYVEGDLFVSTAGYTQGVLITTSVTAESWFSQPSTGQASPGQLAALRSALDVNHVGLEQGSCVLIPLIPFNGTFELTWYGRHLRGSDLTVYISGGPSADRPSCPPEVCQILQAIAVYSGAVLKPSPPAFVGNCPAPPP